VKSAPASSSCRECTRWCTPVTITPPGPITAVPISCFRDSELEAGAATVTAMKLGGERWLERAIARYECATLTVTVEVAVRLPASETLTQ